MEYRDFMLYRNQRTVKLVDSATSTEIKLHNEWESMPLHAFSKHQSNSQHKNVCDRYNI